MMRKILSSRILFTLLLPFLAGSIFAQDDGHDHGHSHHSFEIGVANAPVYFLKEKEISYGLHLHGIYTFPHTRYGIGLGYERIFDEHEHQTIGLVGSYRLIDPLSFIVSPGITFEKEEETETAFAIHFETAYEFELGDFHIGPVAEVAYDPEDIHLSLGIHIGYGL